jgi:uncharacterized glyoxalase superfamily protein PhnB
MAADPQRATIAPAVYYEDPMPALEWLERAFGFERSLLITDESGSLVHSELTFGDGYLMVARSWAEFTATPAAVGGKNTQNLHVQLEADLDGHCARAEAAGAVILQRPEDQFYGDRTYRARDPGGHVWTFGQTVRVTTPADWKAETGLDAQIFS